MHVLVVDDEPSIAEVVETALEMNGFSVDVAHDGREALLRLSERRPDLVVTDFMMPFASGLDLAAAIRARPDMKDVPIVLMSAVSEPPSGARELCSGFLKKPFDITSLLRAVRKFTGEHADR